MADPSSSNYRRVPCSYFAKGLCNRGDGCTFIHSGPPATRRTSVDRKSFQSEGSASSSHSHPHQTVPGSGGPSPRRLPAGDALHRGPRSPAAVAAPLGSHSNAKHADSSPSHADRHTSSKGGTPSYNAVPPPSSLYSNTPSPSLQRDKSTPHTPARTPTQSPANHVPYRVTPNSQKGFFSHDLAELGRIDLCDGGSPLLVRGAVHYAQQRGTDGTSRRVAAVKVKLTDISAGRLTHRAFVCVVEWLEQWLVCLRDRLLAEEHASRADGCAPSVGVFDSQMSLVTLSLGFERNCLGDASASLAIEMLTRHVVWLRVAVLWLYMNRLGDSAAANIAAFIRAHPHPIAELHLSHNKITSLGAVAILRAVKESGLYERAPQPLWLRMEFNTISVDQALSALSPEEWCPAQSPQHASSMSEWRRGEVKTHTGPVPRHCKSTGPCMLYASRNGCDVPDAHSHAAAQEHLTPAEVSVAALLSPSIKESTHPGGANPAESPCTATGVMGQSEDTLSGPLFFIGRSSGDHAYEDGEHSVSIDSDDDATSLVGDMHDTLREGSNVALAGEDATRARTQGSARPPLVHLFMLQFQNQTWNDAPALKLAEAAPVGDCPLVVFLDTNAAYFMATGAEKQFSFASLMSRSARGLLARSGADKIIVVLTETVMSELDGMKSRWAAEGKREAAQRIKWLYSESGPMQCESLRPHLVALTAPDEALTIDDPFSSVLGSLGESSASQSSRNDRAIMSVVLRWNHVIGKQGRVLFLTGDKDALRLAKSTRVPSAAVEDLSRALDAIPGIGDRPLTSGDLIAAVPRAFVDDTGRPLGAPLAPPRTFIDMLAEAASLVEALVAQIESGTTRDAASGSNAPDDASLVQRARKSVAQWKDVTTKHASQSQKLEGVLSSP